MKGFYPFLFVTSCFLSISFGVMGVGINYGLLGDNLPPPDHVIDLLRSKQISNIRIFDPNPDVLKALENSDIEVIIGVKNEDLRPLSEDLSYAQKWVDDNIKPCGSTTKIKYITAGNEVIPGPLADYVLIAMQNLYAALNVSNIKIPVTTVVSMQVLGNSYPPSEGAFSTVSNVYMGPIGAFLSNQQTSLLVNVYPYFAYASNRKSIPLSYALLEEGAPGVSDGANQYTNMFDAMVDAVYSALENVGAAGCEIVVSETGWPSKGDIDATIDNAQTYINNLIKLEKSGKGTPKRPGKSVERYIFALFKEDLKPAGVEQHFGLFYPNMTEVYHVNLAPDMTEIYYDNLARKLSFSFFSFLLGFIALLLVFP